MHTISGIGSGIESRPYYTPKDLINFRPGVCLTHPAWQSIREGSPLHKNLRIYRMVADNYIAWVEQGKISVYIKVQFDAVPMTNNPISKWAVLALKAGKWNSEGYPIDGRQGNRRYQAIFVEAPYIHYIYEIIDLSKEFPLPRFDITKEGKDVFTLGHIQDCLRTMPLWRFDQETKAYQYNKQSMAPIYVGAEGYSFEGRLIDQHSGMESPTLNLYLALKGADLIYPL